MEITNILTAISINYDQFTRTGKKIADYVQRHSKEVPFMSITELADACHVAEASVHRFCRTLKIKGYQEFKMMLSISTKMQNEVQPPVDECEKSAEDRSRDFFHGILESHLDAIRETNELLDPEVVWDTVDMMTAAKRILFFGVGNSLMTAAEAHGRFIHITPKVEFIVDAHIQSMVASMATPEDMILFFSYSGSTSDNILLAEIARKKGAKIAVITRHPRSALTRNADAVLVCGSKEGPLEGGSMGGKMSQLHIIDVLFQCYYQKNLEESRRNNEQTAAANLDRFIDEI